MPWAASQQQHTSSLQAGQSNADGASRHSSGEHPQSAQRITNLTFVDIDGTESRAVLYNSRRPCKAAMWFITLVKFRRQPTKAETQAMNSYTAEATKKWGAKVHNTFWTLGRYDSVWITEAPDEKTQMKILMGSPFVNNVATETLVAVSRDEAIGWLK